MIKPYRRLHRLNLQLIEPRLSSLQSFVYDGEASAPEIDDILFGEETPRLTVEDFGFEQGLDQPMNADQDSRRFLSKVRQHGFLFAFSLYPSLAGVKYSH
jgi:hypothetical protein